MAKKVVMKEAEVKTAVESNTNKLTYEQLENAAHQMQEQLQKMYKRVYELESQQVFTRLHYLFEVVKNADILIKYGKDLGFIENSIDEIKDLMVIKEEDKEEE